MALLAQHNGELEVVTFDDPTRPKSTPPSVAHQTARLDPPPRTPQTLAHRPKIRFSIDASALMPNAMQTLSRSPVSGEGDSHSHITGLRRIRQQQHAVGGQPPSGPPSTAVSRVNSMSVFPNSPILGSCEDLAKFPMESLHSFSFAQQTEDHLHSRQSIVKRGLEFMKDRLGMTTATPMLLAQAKAGGDEEVQSVMNLLEKANVFTEDKTPMMVGPASAGPDVRGNPFDKSFSLGFDGEDCGDIEKSEGSSNSGTNESYSTSKTTPPRSRVPTSLKRTYTDVELSSLKSKLDDALAEPFMLSQSERNSFSSIAPHLALSPVHGHAMRSNPTCEAIFTTEVQHPWTILAANDTACLIFGVTKSEVRKIGIMELIQEERRDWLQQKLESTEMLPQSYPHSHHNSAHGAATLMPRDLPNKAIKRSQTSGWRSPRNKNNQSKSRGVILCGDVVPIQKRNGNAGTASLWVKEKKGGLIWVLEEISEDMAYLHFDDYTTARIGRTSGKLAAIFGESHIEKGTPFSALLPSIPCRRSGEIDLKKLEAEHHYTASNRGVFIPCYVDMLRDGSGLRVSSFPHMAGIIVLSTLTLTINSCNSVFTDALFGLSNTVGQHINDLLPGFDSILRYITDEEKIPLVDGMVIPEHLFRKARAAIARREDKDEALYELFRPSGLTAKHRDGSELRVDVQMRVVQSESSAPYGDAIVDDSDEEEEPPVPELMFALWVTYSRHFHAVSLATDPAAAILKRPITPPRQPSPGQPSPPLIASPGIEPSITAIEKEIAEAVQSKVTDISDEHEMSNLARYEARKNKKISDFIILEDMGQGAYGQVKLARHKKASQQRVVLKYVTKKRILVDTWTRDRRLGTVPLEIHILNYLKESGLQHPNIVEMIDFFEDDINYYIEMVPHGLPGMDLFDYIELMINMDETEARSIFVQVARAVYHLHIRAGVVHRDIKDENVVLDGNGRIKLIDFGSAAFISKGPFDVFVGTIDYAAPETLQGNSYAGKPQDIWALGVLLYTICYKENPFYNVDEIMDHEIRIPYLLSDRCLDLIRGMLDRDVNRRLTIEQVLTHPWFEGLPGPDEAFKVALEEEAALKRSRLS